MEGPDVLRALALKHKAQAERENKERFANILSAVNTAMRTRASEGHFDATIDTGHIYFNGPKGSDSPIRYRLSASEIQHLVEKLKISGHHVEMRIDPELDDLIFIKW